MKRKGRRHLPKVPEEIDITGTLPLGEDPPLGPWGPMGRIQSYGVMARAWNRGTPRQRRAAAVFLAVVALPMMVYLAGSLISLFH
jgi:hypothetical protein